MKLSKKLTVKVASVIALSAAVGCYAYDSLNSESSRADVLSQNIEALADNPFCENGCHLNGSGCYCHYYFPSYKEHVWED